MKLTQECTVEDSLALLRGYMILAKERLARLKASPYAVNLKPTMNEIHTLEQTIEFIEQIRAIAKEFEGTDTEGN